MLCFHVVVVVFFGCITKCISQNACFGVPSKESEGKQPIFLHNRTSIYTFIVPDNGTFVFHQAERFIISCPDPRNFLQASNSNITVGICDKGKIKIANKVFNYNDLQCSKSIRGDVKTTNRKCGNNLGYLTNIGYYIGKIEFISLIEVCHEPNRGNTLYSEHIMYGKSIRNASRTQFRPSFSTLGLGSAVSASIAYKLAFQKSTFNKLLGSTALADLYINRKSFLSRGHLSPDADFLFAAWQFTTYFYINTCPQWQVINGGNWVKIESAIRKLGNQLQENIRIITGCYGILALPDINNKLQPIYLLSGDTLPVPEYIWKIVYRESTQEAIVLVSLNNPFQNDNNTKLCTSICDQTGWGHKNFSKPEKGLVHCCHYKDFVNKVHTVPTLRVKNVLKGPHRK